MFVVVFGIVETFLAALCRRCLRCFLTFVVLAVLAAAGFDVLIDGVVFAAKAEPAIVKLKTNAPIIPSLFFILLTPDIL